MRLNPINVAFRPYRRRTGVAKPLKPSSTDFVIFSETYVFFVTSLSAGPVGAVPIPERVDLLAAATEWVGKVSKESKSRHSIHSSFILSLSIRTLLQRTCWLPQEPQPAARPQAGGHRMEQRKGKGMGGKGAKEGRGEEERGRKEE